MIKFLLWNISRNKQADDAIASVMAPENFYRDHLCLEQSPQTITVKMVAMNFLPRCIAFELGIINKFIESNASW